MLASMPQEAAYNFKISVNRRVGASLCGPSIREVGDKGKIHKSIRDGRAASHSLVREAEGLAGTVNRFTLNAAPDQPRVARAA